MGNGDVGELQFSADKPSLHLRSKDIRTAAHAHCRPAHPYRGGYGGITPETTPNVVAAFVDALVAGWLI